MAVGHEHVNVKKIEIVINHQLIKIIYLKQDLKLQQFVADKEGDKGLVDDDELNDVGRVTVQTTSG